MTETVTVNERNFRELLRLARNVAEDRIADLLERYQPDNDHTADTERRRFRREANEAYELITLVAMFRGEHPMKGEGQSQVDAETAGNVRSVGWSDD